MGVMSRKVLPVADSLCYFCPSMRTRSRQPVKRYKKLLAEIFRISPVGFSSWQWRLFLTLLFVSHFILLTLSIIIINFRFWLMLVCFQSCFPYLLFYPTILSLLRYNGKKWWKLLWNFHDQYILYIQPNTCILCYRLEFDCVSTKNNLKIRQFN